MDLVAVHAWSDTGVFEFPGWTGPRCSRWGETLSERLAGWQERYPDVLVRRVVVADKPAHQLSSRPSPPSCWWWAATAAGFARMLLGSVSTAVIHAARMPVIVAR